MDDYVWDRQLKRVKRKAEERPDLLTPGSTPRELAIGRVLGQAVEAWIEGNIDGAIRMVVLAERFVSAPKSTFDK